MSTDLDDVRTKVVLKEKERELLDLQILELSSCGNSIVDISSKLNISTHRVRKGLETVKHEMRSQILSNFVAEATPTAVAETLTLNKIIIKKCFEIENKTSDMRVRLEALRLINQIQMSTNNLISETRTIANAIQRSLLIVNKHERPLELNRDDADDNESLSSTKDEGSVAV
jgi:hypothetical protein